MSTPIPQLQIDDETLRQMMQDPNVTSRFPFLATTLARANAQKAGCSGCTAKRRRPAVVDYGVVRRQLAEMPLQQKAKLKQVLNAKQVVIRYNRPNGQVVKLKF